MTIHGEALPERIPLCVDLDGTLVHTDTLQESLALVLRRFPWRCFGLLFLLLTRGRARFKSELARLARPDAALLPYHGALVARLRAYREANRPVYLVTGAHETIAADVAAHLGLFTGVMASDETRNLVGRRKAALLVATFGEKGFAYAGDSSSDLAVWKHAGAALSARGGARFVRRIQAVCPAAEVLAAERGRLAALWRGLRVYQWPKNLLAAIPFLASHRFTDLAALADTAVGIAALCLCASGAYLLNDVLDIESDRRHPVKAARPLASGQLPILAALACSLGLLVSGILLAGAVSAALVGCVVLYIGGTFAYSLFLRRLLLLDVIGLALLYVLRVLTGYATAHVPFSNWLVAFSWFFFLSLAFLKRYAELKRLAASGFRGAGNGRPYWPEDLSTIQIAGVGSGLLAAVVLGLYVDGSRFTVLYQAPQVLWLWCPIVMGYLCRLWLLAGRGEKVEDPVLFTLRDPVSYWIALALAAVFVIATYL